MARILPSDIRPLALAGAHSGEFQTLVLLRAQLGPKYAALHSVHWSYSQGQSTRFGEIDFIRDEGQDFEADWLEILKHFLAEDGRILWLADPDQNLLGKPPVELPGFVRPHSRHNYRSPCGIVRGMRRLLPFDFEPANPLPGLGLGVRTYREADNQAKHLDEVVGNLISLGLARGDRHPAPCAASTSHRSEPMSASAAILSAASPAATSPTARKSGPTATSSPSASTG